MNDKVYSYKILLNMRKLIFFTLILTSCKTFERKTFGKWHIIDINNSENSIRNTMKNCKIDTLINNTVYEYKKGSYFSDHQCYVDKGRLVVNSKDSTFYEINNIDTFRYKIIYLDKNFMIQKNVRNEYLLFLKSKELNISEIKK